ncbi:4-hydroxy-tetrahydrodipicolinate synthase [Caminibacter mediatlanticus TB-2]|uniref:4-hydroxy-tetrahydrodipicolinate synthase n=1 Tax=Caminibacter mediatlanticus TB-2 TaxID=391592 RepID=A0ABX5V959_9BACT|nr:4-hydroxy-tetrahydrodipicolinate synthase [Caminibacter mediatlanticus]QCT94741.1 4-hydroxy-tetrahydrodipicolinate synthase [Caminibacter mediatlanticus TB-2]
MQGAMTALITPFRNGKVDEETYAKLIQRQIDNDIDWVVPVGTTGESATLTHDEHKKCIEIAVEVCKGTDTKVLAGAGSNSTHEAIDLAKFAQQKGANAILSVAPYYNKPTQKGLYEHYKALAESIEIPLVLYNVPGRTCSNIEVETAVRLFNDVENIVAIKEATGKIENVVALCSKCAISVISGDDAINFPIIASGGKGVISVASNLVPKKIAKLVHKALKGDFIKAREINEELYELNKVLFIESNPIPIKYAMYEAGLIPSLEYRLPLVEPSEESKRKIKEVIKRYL